MRKTLTRVFGGLIVLGLAILAFAGVCCALLERDRFISLGTLGPYSFLFHRTGLLVSRRILVWQELNLVSLGIALVIVGIVVLIAMRARRPPRAP